MLLRSFSAPILNVFRHHSRDSSPEPEFRLLKRTNSISFTSSVHSVYSFNDSASKKLTAVSRVKPLPRRNQRWKSEIVDVNEVDEEAKPRSRIRRFSGSGFGEIPADGREREVKTLVEGGGIGGGRGGGGRRSDGDAENDGSEFHNSTDAYYEKMISADPGNSLLLGNYAKYLKEIRRDYGKAEEYYGRAILANPNDGKVLSLYADLIWDKDKDSERAENYFDQAAKTAPEDSYVMASYARFLWDTEEEEIEAEGGKNEGESPPRFFNGNPLAAAS